DLARELTPEHGPLRFGGAIHGGGLRPFAQLFVGKRRDVVGPAPERGEQRVVSLVDASLLELQCLVREQRRERQAARLIDVALTLVRATELFVRGAAVGEQDVVEARLRRGERERRFLLGLDAVLAEGEHAARDALDVARALARRTVDEERAAP